MIDPLKRAKKDYHYQDLVGISKSFVKMMSMLRKLWPVHNPYSPLKIWSSRFFP